ncbi:hypothetical protein [uncultured Helicobacter sp.]|uniref:hypothetical protein n=1 Tax=uncultured Helicobacter sp. TaxID=175537 RepID=UPI00259A2AFA|nr:hypothetical protein [uncultured Helicobacter sp.]
MHSHRKSSYLRHFTPIIDANPKPNQIQFSSQANHLQTSANTAKPAFIDTSKINALIPNDKTLQIPLFCIFAPRAQIQTLPRKNTTKSTQSLSFISLDSPLLVF